MIENLKEGDIVRLTQSNVDSHYGVYKKTEYRFCRQIGERIQLRPIKGRNRKPIWVDENEVIRCNYDFRDEKPFEVQEVVTKKYITSNGKTFTKKEQAKDYEYRLYTEMLVNKILNEAKLSNDELRELINQAYRIEPKNKNLYILAHTLFFKDLSIESLKHLPDIIKMAKAIVDDNMFTVIIKDNGKIISNKKYPLVDNNWHDFKLSDDYNVGDKEINEETKTITFTIAPEIEEEDEFEYIELTDEERMLALEYAGVDNWTYYSDAIAEFREENNIPDDEELSLEDELMALENAGVDNWSYYGDAIEDYIREYKKK